MSNKYDHIKTVSGKVLTFLWENKGNIWSFNEIQGYTDLYGVNNSASISTTLSQRIKKGEIRKTGRGKNAWYQWISEDPPKVNGKKEENNPEKSKSVIVAVAEVLKDDFDRYGFTYETGVDCRSLIYAIKAEGVTEKRANIANIRNAIAKLSQFGAIEIVGTQRGARFELRWTEKKTIEEIQKTFKRGRKEGYKANENKKQNNAQSSAGTPTPPKNLTPEQLKKWEFRQKIAEAARKKAEEEAKKNKPKSLFEQIEEAKECFGVLTGYDFSLDDFDHAKRLYRRACMAYHPDHNPAGRYQFEVLNTAWEMIKKDFELKDKEPEGATETN